MSRLLQGTGYVVEGKEVSRQYHEILSDIEASQDIGDRDWHKNALRREQDAANFLNVRRLLAYTDFLERQLDRISPTCSMYVFEQSILSKGQLWGRKDSHVWYEVLGLPVLWAEDPQQQEAFCLFSISNCPEHTFTLSASRFCHDVISKNGLQLISAIDIPMPEEDTSCKKQSWLKKIFRK